MSRAVAFRRAARSEIEDAAAWYGARRPEIGTQFLAEVERCVALWVEHPERFTIVHRDIRRVTLRCFPHSIYFRVEAHRIVVLAVFHGRRDPQAWMTRP